MMFNEEAVDLNKSVEIEKLKLNGFIFVQVISAQVVSVFKIYVAD